eukprot:364692-Chlamydomonas_euryale.AAC.15
MAVSGVRGTGGNGTEAKRWERRREGGSRRLGKERGGGGWVRGGEAEQQHRLCIRGGASEEVHQRRCIRGGASEEVHQRRCIRGGASEEVHHRRCITGAARLARMTAGPRAGKVEARIAIGNSNPRSHVPFSVPLFPQLPSPPP